MEYTNNCTETKYASNGKGNAGLALGIVGTSLAGLLAANSGLLGGGLLGGGPNAAYAMGPHGVIDPMAQVSALEAKVAELQAMRYTDQIGIEVFNKSLELSNTADAKIGALQNQLYGFVIDLDKKTALNEQAGRLNREYDTMARDYQFALMDSKINCCCEKAAMTSDFNQQVNSLADASLLSYVSSNFCPGVLKLPITSVCPLPETATSTTTSST